MLIVPELNRHKQTQPVLKLECVGGCLTQHSIEKWNARASLGLASSGPVQTADVGSWGGFPLTAQKGRGKPWILRSREWRDVRKRPAHSTAGTENSPLCWALATAQIGLDCAHSLAPQSPLLVLGRAAYLTGSQKLL